MADTKLTALTADTAPTSDDITYVVNDPGGTPASKKVTLQNVITKAHGLSDGVVSVSSGTMTSTKQHQIVAKESGQYYSMPGLASASTSLTMTASGVLTAHPVWLQAGSYDRIAVATTVAAVSTWRFGVYPSGSDGLPDGETLILDCGTIDMNQTAATLTATISLTISTSGVYWLAALVDSYTATPTVYGWTTTSGTAQTPLLGAPVQLGTAAVAARHYISRTATGVSTGSMPATFPSASWAANSPKIGVRAA